MTLQLVTRRTCALPAALELPARYAIPRCCGRWCSKRISNRVRDAGINRLTITIEVRTSRIVHTRC